MNRSTARVAIVAIAAFGWVLVAGVTIGALLPYLLSGASFGIAGVLSLVLITVFLRLRRSHSLPDQAAGTIPWILGAAQQFGVSAAYLTGLATSAAWQPRIVLALVWTPLWLLLAFIAFLWGNALVQFFS